MWRALISIIAIAGASSSVAAQTITDPAEVAAHLKFWTQETGDPVYYGEVRDVDARSKRVGDANSPTDFTESTFLLGECDDEAENESRDDRAAPRFVRQEGSP